MDEITKKENDGRIELTDAAIAGARKIALGSSPLMSTVGRLSDGWIVTAIFGWVALAPAQGSLVEQAAPNRRRPPQDIAVVRSILLRLADQAATTGRSCSRPGRRTPWSAL